MVNSKPYPNARKAGRHSFGEPSVRRTRPAPEGTYNGAVAQLGERYVRNVEVRGSIPLGSTIFRTVYQLHKPWERTTENPHKSIWHKFGTVLEDSSWLVSENEITDGMFRSGNLGILKLDRSLTNRR